MNYNRKRTFFRQCYDETSVVLRVDFELLKYGLGWSAGECLTTKRNYHTDGTAVKRIFFSSLLPQP